MLKNILWMAGGLGAGLLIWALYAQMQKAKAKKAADAAAAAAAAAATTTTTTTPTVAPTNTAPAGGVVAPTK